MNLQALWLWISKYQLLVGLHNSHQVWGKQRKVCTICAEDNLLCGVSECWYVTSLEENKAANGMHMPSEVLYTPP